MYDVNDLLIIILFMFVQAAIHSYHNIENVLINTVVND